MRKYLSRAIAVIVLGYVGLIALMYVGQERLMYFPDRRIPVLEKTKVPEMKEVRLETTDGLDLRSWLWLPKDLRAPVVVMFHGNAENIATRDVKARVWMDAGLGVMLLEYRGYGGNPGRISEEGLLNDARAAVVYLRDEKHVTIDRMVFYGESLGSGVAARMAAENTAARGLVLEVPFDSALSVAQERYPFILGLPYLMKDHFRSDLLVGGINMPKLVLLAGQDRIVPHAHGRRLFDLAAEPKTLKEYPQATHNTVYDFGAGKDVVRFIKGLTPRIQTEFSRVPSEPLRMGREDDASASTLPPHPLSGLPQERVTFVSAGETLGSVVAEVATKPLNLEHGLMGRTEMEQDHGMLFVMPSTMIAWFWMKDTLIPLDMIFIDAEGRIVNIHENATPKDERSIQSTYPVRAVLEVNGGHARTLGLSPGDLVLSSTLDQLRVSEPLDEQAPDQAEDIPVFQNENPPLFQNEGGGGLSLPLEGPSPRAESPRAANTTD